MQPGLFFLPSFKVTFQTILEEISRKMSVLERVSFHSWQIQRTGPSLESGEKKMQPFTSKLIEITLPDVTVRYLCLPQRQGQTFSFGSLSK